MKKYIKCGVELDDRFAFSFDEIGDEVYIDARANYVPIYLEDEHVIGNGAGMEYGVIVAVPRSADHWQMKEKILTSLDEHVQSIVDGTDYYGGVVAVDSHTHPHYANIPDDVYDDSVFYSATIEIVPYDNIGPYGDYGIDFGVGDGIESSKKINCATYARNELASRIKRNPTDEEVAIVDNAKDYLDSCKVAFESAQNAYQFARRASKCSDEECSDLYDKLMKAHEDYIDAEDKYMDLWDEYIGYSYH